MTKPKSWKEIFFPHAAYYYIGNCAKMAKTAGYPFFEWNGLIYSTDDKVTDAIMLADSVPLAEEI